MCAEITAVPFLDLTREYQELEQEWLAAIAATGAKGSFVLGPNVTHLEQEIAAYVGTSDAVSVANGTDALVLALRAAGIKPGDEVITSPFTFFATAEAITIVGATPVFADIEVDSFNLDPQSVQQCLSPKTRALLPVHIFGCPADMPALMAIAEEHGLKVIEDGAQAFGASIASRRVGSFGDGGCFSFYPTKVLGCYGDGGIITLNDADMAQHLRKLRNHGAVKPFVHDEIGTNSRLDEIQAALLRIKLKRIDAALAARRQVAASYNEQLQDLPLSLPAVSADSGHAFNLYTMRCEQRDALRQMLSEHQVGTSQCYPEPLHRQAVYADLAYAAGSLPVCEQAASETLSLPIYPGMPAAHIDHVCGLIQRFYG